MQVLLADDDRLILSSLRTIITASGDITVAASAASAAEAIAQYRLVKPDIALLDIRMGEETGLDAAEGILRETPAARILFLTTFSDDEYIIRALKLGAKGYLLKQNYAAIVPALHAVMQGQSVFGQEIVSRLPNVQNGTHKTYADFGLTEKEFALLQQIAQGCSNKEAAAALFLSEGTVRNYLSVMLEKLCLRDRTQLAIFYYKELS